MFADANDDHSQRAFRDAISIKNMVALTRWVPSGISWGFSKLTIKRFVRRFTRPRSVQSYLTEDECVHWARVYLYNRYGIPPDLLRPSGLTFCDNDASIAFTDHLGNQYELGITVNKIKDKLVRQPPFAS